MGRVIGKYREMSDDDGEGKTLLHPTPLHA